jgi:hypothetical protein
MYIVGARGRRRVVTAHALRSEELRRCLSKPPSTYPQQDEQFSLPVVNKKEFLNIFEMSNFICPLSKLEG